jgi:hypothetical protein
MRGRVRIARTVVAFATVAATLIVVGAVPSTAVICGGALTLTPLPSGVKSINGIAALTSTDVWGVGTKSGNPDRTAAVHWNGASWTLRPTATLGQGDEGFNGVAAIDRDDVWAVGYSQSNGGYQAMVQHWDGSSWSVVPTPRIGTPNNGLTDVTALSATDIWAVGFSASTTERVPLIEHWDGTTWSVVSAPRDGSMSDGLLGVAAVAADDVWAVGYASDGSGFRPLAEHWDGASWTVAEAFELGTGDSVLTSIAVQPGGGSLAVGYRFVGSRIEGSMYRHDGNAWQPLAGATVESPAGLLLDVAVAGSGFGWAAGFRLDEALGENQTLAERWDGVAWTEVPSPSKRDSSFASVEVVPGTDEVWMGGRFGVMALACPATPPVTAQALAPSEIATAGAAGSGQGAARARTIQAPPLAPAAAATRVPIEVVARERASSAGIAQITKTWGAAVADADGDGFPDIVLGRHQTPARFYENTGASTFVEPSPTTFPGGDRHRCAWIDVNGDLRPDLVCLLGADAGTDFNHSELWIQRPDGSFDDRASSYGLIDPTSRGRTPVPVDANDDGWLDVLVTGRHVRPDGLPAPDHLFLNQGGTAFVSDPTFGIDRDAGIQGSCASAVDFTNDGLTDLVVCRPSGVRVFENVAGTSFRDVTTLWKAQGKAKDAMFADMDTDGLVDEIIALAGRVEVRLQRAGVFRPAISPLASTAVIGVAVGDVNGDGAPDLYLLRGTDGAVKNAPDRLMLNDGTGAGFTEMVIPTTTAGTADMVVSLDFDLNELSDFLVLNGSSPSVPGPVQLIAFYPAP